MTILSRFAKLGVPVAAAVVTAAILNGNQHDNLTVQAATMEISETNPGHLSFLPPKAISVQADSNKNYEDFPRMKWDWNWDNRDPLCMVDPKKLEAAKSEGERKEIIAKKKPMATRNILLVRHGQYRTNSEKKDLTPLGREQAALLGKRLANSGKKFDLLIMSTMPRATETAQIMLAEMDPVQTRSDSLLEEGAPYPPEPPVGHWHPKQHKFFTDGSRIEAAFRKYIHRASPKQKKDSYEIIVCHANVIRYFVCRALQFPPEGWLRFSLGNTSVTWLVVSPKGQVTVHAIGDIGHLPSDKISFS